MEIVEIDDDGRVYLSPAIDDWDPIEKHGISAVIDLDGDLDIGVPSVPDHMLYVYFPIYDEDLPDLAKLHGIARLATELVKTGHKVLSHCGLGLNRSALVTGLILTNLGMSGKDAVELIRAKRPGALFNETFESYLLSLEPLAHALAESIEIQGMQKC
ncbi:MAG TPA: dual specificity protein phosphatase [Blastocatellia bacterium]|nr:dual specificity protein phosphatase [Blastocatellia bacterium]